MIVAITGGTGFIGRALVSRHLELGDEVRVLTRRSFGEAGLPASVRLWQDDLVNPVNLQPFVEGVDVLYHCAAEINDDKKMLAANVNGTKNLVKAAEGKIKHWVQLSSVGVYGTHVSGVITEETQIVPVNVYEESKAIADKTVIEASQRNSFTYSILRPSKVYGPGMKNDVLFRLVSIIDRGFFFFIGKPGASANYIHVDDVVRGLIMCGNMPAARNRVYIISDYRTIENLIAIISQSLNKAVPHLRIPEVLARLAARLTSFIPNNPLTEQRVNAMVKRAKYSTERMQIELGYRHSVSMEDGIRELVRVYQEGRA